MAVSLSALRTRRTSLPRNIIIFFMLCSVSQASEIYKTHHLHRLYGKGYIIVVLTAYV
jgi:hypothetical protein